MSAAAYLDLLTVLLLGLVWVSVAAFLWFRRKVSLQRLAFFTVFYVYIYKVLDYTLFQFQSLLLLRFFIPNLILRGQEAGNETNIVPLLTLGSQDLQTSLLNVLLFVPFGLGLPLITNLRVRAIVGAGLSFSIVIELLQLLTGRLAGMTFRVADVNDVVFNTAGVVLGCVLFVGYDTRLRRHKEQPVPVDRSHDQRNAAERARLAAIARRPEAELKRDLGGGWTVATALAHVAFWDRFAHQRLKLFINEGTLLPTSGPLVDALNDGLVYQWQLLPPAAAAAEALAAAEAMDAEIAGMSDDAIGRYLAQLPPGALPLFLDRVKHRKEHSDQIEAALR